jgi:transposase InsO family protein
MLAPVLTGDVLALGSSVHPHRAVQFCGASSDRVCSGNGIEHRTTKPNHPWTNGQVERMNRTIKEATVKRYHYECHDQLRQHLHDFIDAYNFARRLKTLNGLTPYEYIFKCWTSEPVRFTIDPIHQRLGLNTQEVRELMDDPQA